jgi:hypothetical protein
MADLSIKLKYKEFELELSGDERSVKEEFKEIRTHGLDKILGNIQSQNPDESSIKSTTHVDVEKSSQDQSKSLEPVKPKPTKLKRPSKTITKSSKLITIDLKPEGKEPLRDFYSKFIVKSGFENNTIFLYYLEKILLLTDINPDHIYTCYKSVNQKVPGKLRQNIIDTKRNKSWIETDNMENLKITQIGENFVEHDATRIAHG